MDSVKSRQDNKVQQLLLNQLLTKAKKVMIFWMNIIHCYYYYKIVMIMIRPKAILETRFPYTYCCKSANMSRNMIAVCSSEHAQPLAEVAVNSLVTHTLMSFCCLQGKKEKVTKPHSQGCCGTWTFKVVYTCMFILTEPQAMEVSAGSSDLFAGSTPELLAFVSSWKGNGVVMLRRKTSIVKISGQSPFPRGNY